MLCAACSPPRPIASALSRGLAGMRHAAPYCLAGISACDHTTSEIRMSTSTSEISVSASRGLRLLNTDLDDTDFQILADRAQCFARLTGVRVGHLVEMSSGELRRFSCDLGDAMQVSYVKSDFYLSGHGAEYSGSPGPAIAKSNLVETTKTRAAPFWFFHHNHYGPGNSVEVRLPCKLWRVQA